jgi:uncharacterized membrane protein YphA (DoxX/SURF4 family)
MPPPIRPYAIWQVVLRLIVGGYWLYFSYQKWFDRTWVKDMVAAAAQGSYIPFYREFLQTVALPNWETLALLITIAEGVVGLMILLGFLTRIAAAVGAFITANLIVSFTFCTCAWAVSDFPLVFWFYFSALILNIQLIFDKSSKTFGLQRFMKKNDPS